MKFKSVKPKTLEQVEFSVVHRRDVVKIQDTFFSSKESVLLRVEEARALRDWLNKVLPE